MGKSNRMARLRAERVAWWREMGDQLSCSTCAEGPRCDRCERREAVTVASFAQIASPDLTRDLVQVLGHHHHLCALCRDDVHLDSGLDRIELADH